MMLETRKSLECAKFGDLPHSKDGARDTQGRIASSGLSRNVIVYFQGLVKRFRGSSNPTRKTFRRILAIIAYIISVAAAGYCVYMAVDKWGMVAYLPIVAVTFYALFVVLMLGGDK